MYTHQQLVDFGHKWLLTKKISAVAFKEIRSLCSETPDVIGFGGKVESVIIEVKVSRADFLKDKAKHFRRYPQHGVGTHRVYMCPVGIISLADLPKNWALLTVDVKGKLKLDFWPDFKYPNAQFFCSVFAQERSLKNEMAIMYSCLRRLSGLGSIEVNTPKLTINENLNLF